MGSHPGKPMAYGGGLGGDLICRKAGLRNRRRDKPHFDGGLIVLAGGEGDKRRPHNHCAPEGHAAANFSRRA